MGLLIINLINLLSSNHSFLWIKSKNQCKIVPPLISLYPPNLLQHPIAQSIKIEESDTVAARLCL